MVRSFLAWVLLFVLLAFLCGLISAGPLNELAYSRVIAPLNVVEGEPARQALEKQFGTPFPVSANSFYRASRGDEAYWLRVSVASQDLPALFKGSSFVTCHFAWQDKYRPVFEFGRELGTSEQAQVAWWLSGDTSTGAYIGGECTGTNYRIFRALVDQTNRTQWTLYMEIIQL